VALSPEVDLVKDYSSIHTHPTGALSKEEEFLLSLTFLSKPFLRFGVAMWATWPAAGGFMSCFDFF
jgi:hypothetical protein